MKHHPGCRWVMRGRPRANTANLEQSLCDCTSTNVSNLPLAELYTPSSDALKPTGKFEEPNIEDLIGGQVSEFDTAAEALAAWDHGDIVWSVEMGGLGPGYEQAIQVLTFELVRDGLDKPLPTDKTWPTWGDDTVHRVDGWPGCGFSGAQVGAAKHLALRVLRDGHRGALDTMRAHDKDRLIQVSKAWPHSPLAASPGGTGAETPR